MPEKTDLHPANKKTTRKTPQDNTPKTPVVAIKVGMNPLPELNSTSQKTVLFMLAGLYLAHASLNLFGPIPKRGFSPITLLAIEKVADKEGLTSVLDMPKRPGRKPPIRGPEVRNRREMITTAKEVVGKSLRPVSSSPFLWKETDAL